MSVNAELVKNFTETTRKLDELRSTYQRQMALVESSKNRYNSIMQELTQLGIGSLQELRERIAALDNGVVTELQKINTTVGEIERKLNEVNGQKANPVVAG